MQFPVATDNDFATWKAYNNRYWPAFYLIDISWNVRYTHFWEWGYEEKRKAIQELLSEKPKEKEQWFIRDNLKTNTLKASINLDEVLSWWPSKDWIPAINNPKFLSQIDAEKNAAYLSDASLGIVVSGQDNQARFYGYDVLVWHEIVNDTFWGQKIAVTFCPLCGSAIVYDRNINGREVNFWVSGKLYNSNLLMYDSYDESLWSQSIWEALMWDQLGTELTVINSNLMTYWEFQENYPTWEVLSNDTGYDRNYGSIPYGNYNQTDTLYFPVNSDTDERYSAKELFYIVNDGQQSVAFHWNDLRAEGSAIISLPWGDYKASFNNGLASVERDDTILPWYYEMWFSWISHNQWNKNVWSK